MSYYGNATEHDDTHPSSGELQIVATEQDDAPDTLLTIDDAAEIRGTLHHQVPAGTEHRRVTELSANVVFVNVHAPSGEGNQRRLKDWQRKQLLTNLLQSSSQAAATAGAPRQHRQH